MIKKFKLFEITDEEKKLKRIKSYNWYDIEEAIRKISEDIQLNFFYYDDKFNCR